MIEKGGMIEKRGEWLKKGNEGKVGMNEKVWKRGNEGKVGMNEKVTKKRGGGGHKSLFRCFQGFLLFVFFPELIFIFLKSHHQFSLFFLSLFISLSSNHVSCLLSLSQILFFFLRIIILSFLSCLLVGKVFFLAFYNLVFYLLSLYLILF